MKYPNYSDVGLIQEEKEEKYLTCKTGNYSDCVHTKWKPGNHDLHDWHCQDLWDIGVMQEHW